MDGEWIIVHFELHNIMLVAAKVHTILKSYVVLTWMRDIREWCSVWHYGITQTQHCNKWQCDACKRVILIILVGYFYIQTHDIWEGNMTTKENEIQTENIHDSTSFIACQTQIWRLALNGFGVGTLALCLKKEAWEETKVDFNRQSSGETNQYSRLKPSY